MTPAPAPARPFRTVRLVRSSTSRATAILRVMADGEERRACEIVRAIGVKSQSGISSTFGGLLDNGDLERVDQGVYRLTERGRETLATPFCRGAATAAKSQRRRSPFPSRNVPRLRDVVPSIYSAVPRLRDVVPHTYKET